MDGADFTHQGQLCSFEVFLRTFALDELALLNLAENVHEIDLHDETCSAPEIAGVERWSRAGRVAASRIPSLRPMAPSFSMDSTKALRRRVTDLTYSKSGVSTRRS
jgi:hypothetical protein